MSEIYTREEMIAEAREAFDLMPGSPNMASIVRSWLKDADAGFKDLDPSGRRSEREMKREFEHRAKEADLHMARGAFENLARSPYADPESVTFWLKEAGTGFEALDPSGKRSAREMETAYKEATRQHYLLRSEDSYKLFAKENPETLAMMVGGDLRRAGVDPDTNRDGEITRSEIDATMAALREGRYR